MHFHAIMRQDSDINFDGSPRKAYLPISVLLKTLVGLPMEVRPLKEHALAEIAGMLFTLSSCVTRAAVIK